MDTFLDIILIFYMMCSCVILMELGYILTRRIDVFERKEKDEEKKETFHPVD